MIFLWVGSNHQEIYFHKFFFFFYLHAFQYHNIYVDDIAYSGYYIISRLKKKFFKNVICLLTVGTKSYVVEWSTVQPLRCATAKYMYTIFLVTFSFCVIVSKNLKYLH